MSSSSTDASLARLMLSLGFRVRDGLHFRPFFFGYDRQSVDRYSTFNAILILIDFFVFEDDSNDAVWSGAIR